MRPGGRIAARRRSDAGPVFWHDGSDHRGTGGPGHCGSNGCATEGPSVGCAAEPDLRARAVGITLEAASLPNLCISGIPTTGTRDGATVSFFVVALAATLALVGPHQV